jgi:argininosuccinate lyase
MLLQVHAEWASGKFVIQPSDEDIHTANERRLGEVIGAAAGKLHTGRSRNDQVATDVRLWLRDELTELRGHLLKLIQTATERAAAEADILMPGYTHLQPAQPVRWGHWLMSHAWSWQRDADRLADVLKRVNVMPLGSGALAGHAFGLDRRTLAAALDFSAPTPNSMDAVADRDFIIETLAWASILSVHLSRFAEDLIIYSSSEFGFVGLSDAYSTGSSLMPQKKNPDALELLRGKTGRVVGSLNALLVLTKGLPTTYNKDLQEDKEPLFDAVDTLHGTIPIAVGVLSTLTPRTERMRARLIPEMLATDLADYLVRKGVPFRETHHVAGAAVRLAEETKRTLSDLSADELRRLHPAFGDDVTKVWSYENSVESRDAEGGTSKRAVLEQVEKMRAWMAAVEGR